MMETGAQAVPRPVRTQEWMGYRLYSRVVRESGGRQRTIYFFSRLQPISGTPATVPEGFEVVMRSGAPELRRRR